MSFLKNRTFIVLMGIILVIMALFAIWLYASSTRTPVALADYHIGQNLTEQQKSLVLNISMNNSILNTELVGSGSSLTGGNISEAKGNYYVKNITIGEYDDVDLHISGVLPVVTFIVGDENQEGPTLQAFVDPVKKRVVYIGETWRSVNGNPNNIHLINISIADTGYSYNTNLTDKQQSIAIDIALRNESVEKYLKGQNYTLNGVGMALYGYTRGYSMIDYVYPSASFYIKSGTMVDAYVDIDNNKVIMTDSYFVTPPMIPPMPPQDNTSPTSASPGMPPAAYKINLTAKPRLNTIGGVYNLDLTAYAYDASGNPVVDGTVVDFTIDASGVSFSGIPTNYTSRYYPIQNGGLNSNNSQYASVSTSGGMAVAHYGWFPDNKIPAGNVMITASLNATPGVNSTLYLEFDGTTQAMWTLVPSVKSIGPPAPAQIDDATPSPVPVGGDIVGEFYGAHLMARNNTTIANFINTYGISSWYNRWAYVEHNGYNYAYVLPEKNYSKQLVFLYYRPDSTGLNGSIIWVKLIDKNETLPPLNEPVKESVNATPGFTIDLAFVSIVLILLNLKRK